MTSKCPGGFVPAHVWVFREKSGFRFLVYPSGLYCTNSVLPDITFPVYKTEEWKDCVISVQPREKRPQETSFLVKSIFNFALSHWYRFPPFSSISLKVYCIYLFQCRDCSWNSLPVTPVDMSGLVQAACTRNSGLARRSPDRVHVCIIKLPFLSVVKSRHGDTD